MLRPRTTAVIATLVALCAFGLYLATMAPSIVWAFSGEDSGDLAAAVATWGIPHPTGYPLYILLGGLFSHLIPIGQLAFRLNLMSASCTAAGCALVFLTVLRLGGRRADLKPAVLYIAAACAALALATSRTIWTQSIITEVYALELLFSAAIAFLLASDLHDRRQLYLLAFVAGLSLTHHTTIVFSLAGAAAAVSLRWRRRLLDPALLLRLAALFALPLLLYLLLPLRASQHPASNWGDPSSAGRFIDVVTGAPYRYLIDHNLLHAVRAVPAVLRLAFSQFAWWVIPIAVYGAVSLFESDNPYVLYLVVVAVLSAGFLSGYHAAGREVYLLQAYVVVSIGFGYGLIVAARLISDAMHDGSPRRLTWMFGVFGLATVVPWAVMGLHDFNLRHDWQALTYAENTLFTAPPGATIFTDTDEKTFALWYVQRALHDRRDVTVVDTRFRDPEHQR